MAKRKSKVAYHVWRIVKVLLGLAGLGLLGFLLFVYFKQPTNDREWKDETVVFPEVTIQGDEFQIKNIRDWRYSETEITSKNYIDRNYRISDLKQVWFLVEPFGGWDGIAHTYFTFEFESAPPVSFSVEARMAKDQEYSAVKGLFRAYELYYSWGTEEDLLVRRTLYLGNDVHMYPLQISESGAQALLRNVLQETQDLQMTPRFYNTLTSNCTNNLARQGNLIKPGLIPRFHYARFMTGYADELLYSLGLIPDQEAFEQVMEKYRITDIVNQNWSTESFSEKIREEMVAKQAVGI